MCWGFNSYIRETWTHKAVFVSAHHTHTGCLHKVVQTFVVKLKKNHKHTYTFIGTKLKAQCDLFAWTWTFFLCFTKLPPLASTYLLHSLRQVQFLYSGWVNHCCRCSLSQNRLCGYRVVASPAATMIEILLRLIPVPFFVSTSLLMCGLSSWHISLPLFSTIVSWHIIVDATMSRLNTQLY